MTPEPGALVGWTAELARAMLAPLGSVFERQGDRLVHPGGFVAVVDLACTAALPSLVLLGALALFGPLARVPLRRWSIAALAGTVALVAANQLRLVAVLWTGAHAPAHFGWVHEVAGPLWLVAVGALVVAAALRRPAVGVARTGAAVARRGAASAGADTYLAGRRIARATGLSGKVIGGAAAVLLLHAAPAGLAEAAPPMISGDLIVKFRDASEPGRQLAAVLAGQRDMASALPLASRLSADLGVPLVLVQVTSGREALLALDREALGRSLLARAGREAQVQRATMTVPPPGGGLPGAELVLRLELRPAAPAATARAVASRLAISRMPAPRMQPDAAGKEVRLVYDIDAWTQALIERLQQRSDVEYAQANRLLRPAAPAASR